VQTLDMEPTVSVRGIGSDPVVQVREEVRLRIALYDNIRQGDRIYALRAYVIESPAELLLGYGALEECESLLMLLMENIVLTKYFSGCVHAAASVWSVIKEETPEELSVVPTGLPVAFTTHGCVYSHRKQLSERGDSKMCRLRRFYRRAMKQARKCRSRARKSPPDADKTDNVSHEVRRLCEEQLLCGIYVEKASTGTVTVGVTVRSCLPALISGTTEQIEEQRKICTAYAIVFSRELNAEPALLEPMRIELTTGGAELWAGRENRRPPRIQSTQKDMEIERQVQEMLGAGVIRPSRAAVSYSQVLMVPKPDGKWRFCVDFRRMNACTKTKTWPIPNTNHMIDRLGRYKPEWLAKLDLTKGYYQAPLEENSRQLSAFITTKGLYEWNRVAMGLCGAPAYYQEQMSTVVLKDLVYHCCEVYMDDIIIYGTNFEDYKINLEKVLTRLREHNITVNPDKCVLGVQEIEFVGHTFSKTGKCFTRSKLQEVVDFPTPTTQTELMSFLGLANYFRDHIKNHAMIAGSLHEMIDKAKPYRKNLNLKWSQTLLESFAELKAAINACPVLFFLDEGAEDSTVHLYTDASDIGFGAYVCQRFNDGREVPIIFFSKCFTPVQKRWSVPEREAYGIFVGVTKFEHLLRDVRFVLHTDHENLVHIRDSGSPKVIRWKLQLQEFQFDIVHVKGVDNLVADALSRNTLATVDIDVPDDLPHHEWLARLWNSEQGSEDEEWCRVAHLVTEAMEIPDEAYANIQNVHNALVGHHGVENTIVKLQSIGTVWPLMEQHVKKFIKECDCCQKLDCRVPNCITAPYNQQVARPMGCLNIDAIGPFDADAHGNIYAVVMIDTFTRFMCTYPVKDTSAREAIRVLLIHCGTFGKPDVLQTDNGTEFKNTLVSELLELLQVEHRLIIAHNHQQNGIVERANKEVNRWLRVQLYCNKQRKSLWSDLLPFAQRIHNATVVTTTGYAPADLVFGGIIKLNRGLLSKRTDDDVRYSTYDNYLTMLLQHQDSMLQEASESQLNVNRKHVGKELKGSLTGYAVGSYVLLAWPISRMNPNGRPTKLDTVYRGPYQVLKFDEHGTYWLRNLTTGATESPKSVHSLKQFFYDVKRTDPIVVALKDYKDIFLISKIISDNGCWRNKGDLKFEVKWLGYKESTWEPWANVRDNSVLHEYLRVHRHAHMIPKKIIDSA
jgi:transposase InsO family protein